jgi:hypothetical protein
MVNVASASLLALIGFAVVDTAAPVDHWRTSIWLLAAASGVPVFFTMLWHCVMKAPFSRRLFYCALLMFGGVPGAIIYYWVFVHRGSPVSGLAK